MESEARLLLDTPIWIWSLLEPERLSEVVRRGLEDPAAELWLSPLSVWALVALIEDGRVVVDDDAEAWVAAALRAVPVREAVLSHEIARRGQGLSGAGLAGLQRLLAATAQVHDLTLVTADPVLMAVDGVRVLANT